MKYKRNREKIDEILEFSQISKIEMRASTGNRIKMNFNTGEIYRIFLIDLEQMMKKSNKYSEELKQIINEEIQEGFENVMYFLKNILELKLLELTTRIDTEYFIRKPETKIELMEFQAVIDKTTKEVMGEDIQGNMAKMLIRTFIKYIEKKTEKGRYYESNIKYEYFQETTDM